MATLQQRVNKGGSIFISLNTGVCPHILPSAEGVVMETAKDSLAPTVKVWSLPWGKERHREGKNTVQGDRVILEYI